MENLLTAKEAKELTTRGKENLLNRSIKAVKDAAYYGNKSAFIWTELTDEQDTIVLDEVVNLLKEAGYEVRYEYTNIKQFKLFINW